MDRGVLALVVLVGHVLAERYENGAADGNAAVQALVAVVRPSAAPCQTAQMADVSAPCRQSKIDPTGTQMNDCEFCNGVYRESQEGQLQTSQCEERFRKLQSACRELKQSGQCDDYVAAQAAEKAAAVAARPTGVLLTRREAQSATPPISPPAGEFAARTQLVRQAPVLLQATTCRATPCGIALSHRSSPFLSDRRSSEDSCVKQQLRAASRKQFRG
jgi:hypothetical protein